MNRRKAATVLVCAVFVPAGIASAEILNFTAMIDGEQANSCNGTGSEGTGTGNFTLDTDTGEVDYNITFEGLGANETAAHVHGAAARCANTGVVYALPPGSPKVGQVTLTAQQMQDMIDGLHYVNIHSEDWPGGEIRGQVELDSGVPATSTWGLAALVLCILAGGAYLAMRGRTTQQVAA